MDIQIKRIIKLGNLVIPVLKGEKGDKGEQGKQGIQGVAGQDGYTPLRGIDYWTQADKDAIKQEIYAEIDPKLDNKVEKEQGKGLSTNDFTNILKEKLENLENYNDEEIRNLLNGSLKGVNYTASNGVLTFTKNDGSTLSVDLPLELLIESGRYDEANKQIVLVLANGNSINIPVSSLLDDFYGKSETYNKTEVDDIIAEKQALIDKLEEENKKQQEELDILNSEYTEKELEGESVVVKDGLPKSKIKVKGNGNSYQETTEGYNKLNIYTDTRKPGITYSEGGITVTYKEKGVINLKGTSTKQTDFYIRGTWGDDNKEVICTLKAGDNTAYLSDDINNKVTMFLIKRIEGVSSSIAGVMSKGTFNLTEDTNVTAMMLRVPTNITLDIDLTPMVYEGTENKPYEPFTNGVATPNTNHKQDIEVITECSLVQRGINRVNFSKPNSKSANTTYSFENDTLNISSTGAYRFLSYNITDLYKNNNGKQIRFVSKDITKNENATIGVQLNIVNADGTKQYLYLINTNGSEIIRTIQENTSNIQEVIMGVYSNNSSNNVEATVTIAEPMLLIGDVTDKPYEPYIEPIVHPINLNGNSLAKVGEIADLLNIGVDGSVSIEKKIEKLLLPKGSFWYIHSTDKEIVTNINTKKFKNNANLICNVFKYISWKNNIYDNILHYGESKTLDDETKAEVLEQIKATDVEVYSILRDEYVETMPLPSIEPITLFEGTNIFELETNLGTTLAVTYKVSNKKKILNLEERISALESAVIGG